MNLSLLLFSVIMLNNCESQLIRASDELPLFWGWLVKKEDSQQLLAFSFERFRQTLQDVPDFLQDVKQFTGQSELQDIVAYYTRKYPEEQLHCTAMFNGVFPNYTAGAEEYAQRQDVVDSIGHLFTIHSIGWILTPRTFGARLKLTGRELVLWNQDDNESNTQTTNEIVFSFEKKQVEKLSSIRNWTELHVIPQDPDILGNFHPTSGLGSRAHLTLGCAPGISSVTTGLDLLDIIRLEQKAIDTSSLEVNDIPTYETEDGWLRNYGLGQWAFYPKTQCVVDSVFGGSDRSSSNQLLDSQRYLMS